MKTAFVFLVVFIMLYNAPLAFAQETQEAKEQGTAEVTSEEEFQQLDKRWKKFLSNLRNKQARHQRQKDTMRKRRIMVGCLSYGFLSSGGFSSGKVLQEGGTDEHEACQHQQ